MKYEITTGLAYRVVTERRGSWRWQDAYRIATYEPRLRARGAGYIWVSVYRGPKFAKTRANRDRYHDLRSGSLHHKPARAVVDDFGTLLFVID